MIVDEGVYPCIKRTGGMLSIAHCNIQQKYSAMCVDRTTHVMMDT